MVVGVVACASAQFAARDSELRLYSLIATDWAFETERSPAIEAFNGESSRINAWPDLSAEGIRLLDRTDNERLSQLRRIDAGTLRQSARLDYRLFQRDLLLRRDAIAARAYLTNFWQFERFGPSPLHLVDFLRMVPAMTPQAAETLPKFVDQLLELLRESKSRRMLPPRDVVRSAITRLQHKLDAAPNDSLRRLSQFLSDDYLPHCPVSPSLSRWPNGREMYGMLLRLSTTTNLTAEQIHATGLEEVARIRAAMQTAARETGHRGSIPEFTAKLRADERFYYKSPDELIAAYGAAMDRVAPKLATLFRSPPQSRPSLIARTFGATGAAASYVPPAADGSRPGRVLINVSNLELRPSYEVMAVMLHEVFPGHHLQTSIERASAHSHAVQRLRQSIAFSEGWGLYAESLGYDLGAYNNAYERFGQLTYEMIRAVRMVVDTGIHAKDWSREQAIRYFIQQTGKPSPVAEGEIDRVISAPGSLAPYKVGELAFRRMRARASATLERNFDIRAFHDFVLAEGAIPLEVLEQSFEGWLMKTAGERAYNAGAGSGKG
jgi:uncharacterized protein (DUF885 family)